MIINADDLRTWATLTVRGQRWVCKRPARASFTARLRAAWGVLIGRYDALAWTEQETR